MNPLLINSARAAAGVGWRFTLCVALAGCATGPNNVQVQLPAYTAPSAGATVRGMVQVEPVREARREEVGEVDSVAARDKADSGRATAPLRIAEGAAVLDTSGHTIESGVEAALEILARQGFAMPAR